MPSKTKFRAENYVSKKPVNAGELEILNKSLDQTKLRLFYEKNSGFIAALVATIEFIWDRSIPTACTNGVMMAWNPDFFLSLDKESRVTVLAHEAWHIGFQHMARCGHRDPQDYNSAADYVINNMLKDHGYYMDGFPYLLDPQYKGMTTEEVYDKIHTEKPGMYNPQHGDFADPGGGPDSIQGGMSPDAIAKKAMGNVHDAATIAKMSKDYGDLPGEVQQMIDEFLDPKLPWQELLMNFFEALSSVEYSYSRPNRRYVDPILPGKTNRNGLELIHYYLDVSGSITDNDIVRFNSEVKHIKETYNPEKLVLVTFDTKLQDFYEFEEDDEFDQIVVTGRGGTNLTEVWAHAKEHKPSAMVVFTDLYVGIPQENPGVPIIWVVTDNPDCEVPYGTLIHVQDEDV